MSRSGPGLDLDHTPGPGPGLKNSGPGPEVRVWSAKSARTGPGPDLGQSIRFTLPLYLLYIDHSTILITLSRSYHTQLRVSYTYTFLSYVYLLLLPL